MSRDVSRVGSTVGLTRVVQVLAVVAAVLVVVGPVVRIYVDSAQGDTSLPLAWLDEAKRQTDLDGEANLPATFGAALFGLLALGLLAMAGLTRARGQQAWPVVVMAVVACYLGLDEASEIHESFALLADFLHATAGLHNFAWLVPGVLVATAGGLLVLRMSRALPPRLRRRLVVAGAVFLFGAVVMEYVTSLFLVDLPGTLELTTAQPVSYVLLNAVEEGSEMAGALLALAAVFAELRLHVADGSVVITGAPADSLRRTGVTEPSPSLGRVVGAAGDPLPVTTVSGHQRREPHGGEGER